MQKYNKDKTKTHLTQIYLLLQNREELTICDYRAVGVVIVESEVENELFISKGLATRVLSQGYMNGLGWERIQIRKM